MKTNQWEDIINNKIDFKTKSITKHNEYHFMVFLKFVCTYWIDLKINKSKFDRTTRRNKQSFYLSIITLLFL